MRSIGIRLLAIGGLFAGTSWGLMAQHRACGSDDLHQQNLQDPRYRQAMDQLEADYQEHVANPRNFHTEGGVRKIPVVFHFIQSSEIALVDDAACLSQIDVLNEDYRKMAGTPGWGNGVDCQYEFCLATIDPNGCPTTGINRVVAPMWAYHEQADAVQMKGLIQWDPYRYLNIWVPRTIETSTSSGQIIGYATFPYNITVAPYLDGVVIHSSYLGRDGDPTYRGRTGTHEVGHWLGLYHTFQNACQGNTANTCAAQGDRVCDTPQAFEANFGCPSINSCTDSPVDNPDQIENYMDYSDGTCQNMFTQGQKDRMDFYTNSVRSQIWSPSNITSTGCDGTVSAGCTPGPNFEADNVIVCPGTPVQFTDMSLHSPTSWSWSFPGGTPSTSTAQNPVVTYSAAGSYDVTLVATNSVGNATEVKFTYIEVVAPTATTLVQGFEGILSLPQGWMVTDNQGIETWKLTSAARSQGQNSMKVKNFEQRNSGELMSLHSNPFNFQNVLTASMTFDYSYKKFSGLATDKLSIKISSDCGATWTEVWSKSGPYLATVAGNAASTEWVPTLSTHWLSDTVNLDSFAGQPNLKARFDFNSGAGQSVYLDNINMTTTMVAAPDPALLGWDFQVAPNPFHDNIRIRYNLAKAGELGFVLTDMSGKVMLDFNTGRQSAGSHELPVTSSLFKSLPAGVYFLKGTGAAGAVTRKLVKMD